LETVLDNVKAVLSFDGTDHELEKGEAIGLADEAEVSP
jgi:hypothetical protein